jgi:general stress protein 26
MTHAGAERQRVRALIERAGVAMLMNVDEKGTHVGRPMLPLLVQSDPHIYFVTHQSSRKVTQLAVRPQVGLSIISTNCFVVMNGCRPALARS